MPATKDISGRFVTTTWQSGRYFYKEVSGELGVPGQVVKHYSAKENRAVSAGTGGHASHLVGKQFGAPGDRRNLTLGNPNINTYAPKNLQEALGKGGNYHKLEEEWTAKLNSGTRIWVRVRDVFRAGEKRPFQRQVEWVEVDNKNIRTEPPARVFGNFSSPQERQMENQPLPPKPSGPGTSGLLPLVGEELFTPVPLTIPTANSPIRRMAGNQAAAAILGQMVTEFALWLGHLGIERQVRKELETTHAQEIKDIYARGDGVLVVVRIRICAMNPDTPRTEQLISVTVVGGRTREEALARWIHEPKIVESPDLWHDIDETYGWMPPNPPEPQNGSLTSPKPR